MSDPNGGGNAVLPIGEWMAHCDVRDLLSLREYDFWYRWRGKCEIIPQYMPPFPRPDTRPVLVVRHGNSFLRYSRGPRQGFFWDIYGDDLHTVGLALLALLEAPPPPGAEPWVKPAAASAP